MEANTYNDLFISYAIADSPMARRIRDDLVLYNPGIKVYLFEKISNDAEDFWKNIQDNLARSRYFLLIDSPNARKSKWVVKECELAMQQLEQGTLKALIPCLLKPVGEWRNAPYYGISTELLQQLQGEVPQDLVVHLKKLVRQKEDVFFTPDTLLSAIGKLGRSYQELLLKNTLNEALFNQLNRIVCLEFFGYSLFDHDEIYQDEMLKLCEIGKWKFRPIIRLPQMKDFEDELNSLSFDIQNKDIFLHDYQHFLDRYQSNYKTARKRLELLQEECKSLGFNIGSASLKKLKAETPTPKRVIHKLEKISTQQFITLLNFETTLYQQLGALDYEKYKHSIFKYTKDGIRLFSLEISLAECQIKDKEYQIAYDTLQGLVQHFPAIPKGWHTLGRLNHLLKNYEAALQAYNRTLQIIQDPRQAQNVNFKSGKITVLNDKIRTLLLLGRYQAAKKELESIDPDYHESLDYKYALSLTHTKLGYPYQAELVLEDISTLYTVEHKDWSYYKLTAAKLRRLKDYLPKSVSQRLEKQMQSSKSAQVESDVFANRQLFGNWLNEVLAGTQREKLDEYIANIASICRYDRKVNINGTTLARLSYEVFWAFWNKNKFLDAYLHIKRCDQIHPDKLEIKANYAFNAYLLDIPYEEIVNAGTKLSPENEKDKIFLARLFYLKGDYIEAKKYYPNLDVIRKMLDDYYRKVDPNWARKAKKRLDHLQQQKELNPLERLEKKKLEKILALTQKSY